MTDAAVTFLIIMGFIAIVGFEILIIIISMGSDD